MHIAFDMRYLEETLANCWKIVRLRINVEMFCITFTACGQRTCMCVRAYSSDFIPSICCNLAFKYEIFFCCCFRSSVLEHYKMLSEVVFMFNCVAAAVAAVATAVVVDFFFTSQLEI